MSAMSKVDVVKMDYDTLCYFIGQVPMPKWNRDRIEESLNNLRDSLNDIGVEVDILPGSLPGLN